MTWLSLTRNHPDTHRRSGLDAVCPPHRTPEAKVYDFSRKFEEITMTDHNYHDLTPNAVVVIYTNEDDLIAVKHLERDRWGDVVGSSTDRLPVHLKPLDSNKFCWRSAGVARQPGVNKPPTAATV